VQLSRASDCFNKSSGRLTGASNDRTRIMVQRRNQRSREFSQTFGGRLRKPIASPVIFGVSNGLISITNFPLSRDEVLTRR
jgi:hypothetical protein